MAYLKKIDTTSSNEIETTQYNINQVPQKRTNLHFWKQKRVESSFDFDDWQTSSCQKFNVERNLFEHGNSR